MGIGVGRREAIDGAAPDLAAEAVRYQAILDTAPVDLAVLGLGRDAHVAFNEPGSRPGDGVRRLALTESTIAAAAAELRGRRRGCRARRSRSGCERCWPPARSCSS